MDADLIEGVIRPQPLNASRAAISREAERIRESLGYKPGGDLNEIVSGLGGRILIRSFWDALSEGGSIVVRGPRDFDIYLSDATSSRRDRFTIAHELGHYFLHYARQRQSIKKGTVMVGQRSSTGREETEAHWFAAEFLMPEQEFKRRWRMYGGSLANVAEYFVVSTHAVSVRASSLNLS